jgi:hypothetical protein
MRTCNSNVSFAVSVEELSLDMVDVFLKNMVDSFDHIKDILTAYTDADCAPLALSLGRRYGLSLEASEFLAIEVMQALWEANRLDACSLITRLVWNIPGNGPQDATSIICSALGVPYGASRGTF